jgi:5'(3')-deoxyribonucleotidase
MKIALDIDNVTADMAPYLLNHINEKYGTNFTINDIKEWYAKLPHPKGIIDYTKELFRHLDTPGFISKIPMMSGAKEGIEELVRRGHKPFFLTGRTEKKHGPETEQWRREHYPDTKIYYAPEGKHTFARKADMLLDDSPQEIKNFGLHGGNAMIYDRPWNRDISPLYGRRVADWPEFLNTMKTL